MAVGPDGRSYTFEERRQQNFGRLMTSRDQMELNFAFDAADLSSVLSFAEKLSDPALSLLAADTAGARAQAHQVEILLGAAGRYVRNLLDGSPFTKLLIGKDAFSESWLIRAAASLILLGELVWCELTLTTGENALHQAFSAIKGATAGTDWRNLYRSALQSLNCRKFCLKAEETGIELCGVRHGYSEDSNLFDTILDANVVKAVLSPHAHAALAYLGAFEAMMRYPKLQNLPLRFVGDEYKAAERWAKVFNLVIEPQHLRILTDSLNNKGNL